MPAVEEIDYEYLLTKIREIIDDSIAQNPKTYGITKLFEDNGITFGKTFYVMHMLNALDPELISELYHNNDIYRSKYSTL